MSGTPRATKPARTVMVRGGIALSLAILAMAITQQTLTTDSGAMTLPPDFVVSSSQDAGPNTLRDAILAADRLSSRARILIKVKRITLESPLPALVNPHGVEIAVDTGAGNIDAARQEAGAVLRIDSPGSVVRGLRIVNARAAAVIVNAANVELDRVVLSASKSGLLLSAAARDCTILTSEFDKNETGITVEAGARGISILSSVFRGNTRAGFWAVAPGGTEAISSDQSAARERVRIADSVFDGNASGAVIANQSTAFQRSRFIANRESAVLILGGAVRLEDSEIRTSGGVAVSVNSGKDVVIARNTLTDNAASAISVRDSEAAIEKNTLRRNGFGIVSVSRDPATAALVIRDNLVTATTGDAITVIGGSALLQRNRLIENRGAGLRVLDLVQGSVAAKATPRLEDNVLKGNVSDVPIAGTYKLPAAP